ncbi:MAG: multicopper oxidase domain-containing protein [Burkholderiales bacterium]
MKQLFRRLGWLQTCLLALALLFTGNTWAVIDGITGPTFNLTARADYVTTADGFMVYNWGYANGAAGTMQYPGPTLIVNQGDTVTVNLTNTLPAPVSIVFPGQSGIVPTGGVNGLITKEAAANNGTVSYRFVATNPGTYMYHSGTQPALQVEMGLVGALIVRPAVANPSKQAYTHANTVFDREHLFLLTEIDPLVHSAVEAGQYATVDTSNFHPVLWFINGRNAPDTMLDAGIPWMPTQPYNAMPRMHPGEKLLLRVVAAGRDMHPFHTHGNNTLMLARDGRMLESAPGAGPDLASSDFTIKTIPGQTYDSIFEWTGKGVGFDIYGSVPHTCNTPAGFDSVTKEWCPDHGKPLPVILPNQLDLTYGDSYSGSPFLGQFGVLPPGHPGLNVSAGYFHMWHSHNEREIVNNDIFPGGMMTMVIIEPFSVSIP